MIKRLLFVLLALTVTLRAANEPLLIAAAADLQFALPEVLAAVSKQHPEITAKATFGASGSLLAQIENGAPFDLYLSADTKYPKLLIEHGHGVSDSFFVYASGQVVLWAPAASKLDLEKLGLQAVLDPSVRKVSLANPDVAPYGDAAKRALVAAKIYDAAKDRLVLGENVSQAAQFVQSGAADLGFISLSLALSPKIKDAGRHWRVPAELVAPFAQGGVICTRSRQKDAARVISQFLLSDEGTAILSRHGLQKLK